jgi:hypothetical protein
MGLSDDRVLPPGKQMSPALAAIITRAIAARKLPYMAKYIIADDTNCDDEIAIFEKGKDPDFSIQIGAERYSVNRCYYSNGAFHGVRVLGIFERNEFAKAAECLMRALGKLAAENDAHNH